MVPPIAKIQLACFLAGTLLFGEPLASRPFPKIPANPPRLAEVSRRMQAFVDEGALPGAVTLVLRDGALVHLEAVGWADPVARTPLTTDSLFWTASMTKTFTAVAAMMLVEEGRLDLDEPIAKLLPEFDTGDRRHITLRHLLSHTSGLIGDQRMSGNLKETVQGIAERPGGIAPGQRWIYSPGLNVVGRMIEVVSGKRYEDFLNERIFKPLRLTDTTFHPTPEQMARLAKPTAPGTLTPAGSEVLLGPEENRQPNPSAGLFSTARDLARFFQMLLNEGELDGVRILKPETVRAMWDSQTGDLEAGFVPGSAWGLGLGLVREPQGVTRMLSPGSFGHGGMFGTQAWVDRKQRTIYLLLIQRVGLLNSDKSAYREAFQESSAHALGLSNPKK